MKNQSFWKMHYVVRGDPDEIDRHARIRTFSSGPDQFELLCFEMGHEWPNVVISPGSGGHSYVFAELGYEIHCRAYNVFIMPRHGGQTLTALMKRHRDALDYVAGSFNDQVGVYAEGLGGYVVFYLALAHARMKSIVCQNSPAILTDAQYRQALLRDTGPWARAALRRKVMLPIANILVRILPKMKVPIWSYLDWKALIDPSEGAYQVERRLVEDGYLHDPDFDKWYPLSHVVSLVSMPPPNDLIELRTPTMFVVASRGPTPGYINALYGRLPQIKKRLTAVDGSVYWMLSHPVEAADTVCGWFDETIRGTR